MPRARDPRRGSHKEGDAHTLGGTAREEEADVPSRMGKNPIAKACRSRRKAFATEEAPRGSDD